MNVSTLQVHLYASATKDINCIKIKEIAKKKRYVPVNYESQNNLQS